MAQKNMIKVDKGRLYAELVKRGVKAADVSREFGFNPNYIANSANLGRVTNATVLLLDRVYGIKREAYEASEAPAEVKEAAESDGIDYDKLYQTIYAAVYHAVKKAWSE